MDFVYARTHIDASTSVGAETMRVPVSNTNNIEESDTMDFMYFHRPSNKIEESEKVITRVYSALAVGRVCLPL
jgi:hypothetical protein